MFLFLCWLGCGMPKHRNYGLVGDKLLFCGVVKFKAIGVKSE
jgi:hypothetical protein